MMVFYLEEKFGGPYKIKFLDASNKWHGLISKQYWPQVVLKEDKLIIPKNEEWPKDEDKEISVIHWAGGKVGKMNYRLHFQAEVIKRLDYLVKP